jgi:adenylate kinase family enzyme
MEKGRTMCGHFPILIITGRPAAGKSEVIDFLKKCDPVTRLAKYHIANFEELDDFVYVWETFELDDLMTRFGKPRIWSDEKYWFKDQYIWDLYMDRMALDYKKKVLKDPAYHDKMTTLVEFARGGENAIHHALTFLSDEMLNKASLVYIKVPYEESVRKNRRRAKLGQEDSILYHSLPDEKMEYYYKTNDWEKLEAKDPNFIEVKGHKIPYAVFENMPEKTMDPALIAPELERATKKLWSLQK